MDDVVHAFLVPTPAGASYAVAANKQDAKRNVLVGLLRGAASRPVPLNKLVEWTGITDRKAVRGLLFKMQRDGWLTGDVEPFSLPSTPLDVSLSPILAEISSEGMGVLSDAAGLCVAYVGCPRELAEKLAALSAAIYPFHRRYRNDIGGDENMTSFTWSLQGEGGFDLVIRPLYLSDHIFHLTVANVPIFDGAAFVRLVALLSQHSLGKC